MGSDLTTGSVPWKLWGQSWPQTVEGILNIVDQMVDLFWAGRLPGGFRAIAALGVSQNFIQFGMLARSGLDQSMRAMIARAIGARNIPLANHILLQSIIVNFVYSLVMVLIGVFLTDILLRAIGASPEVQAQTATYMRIQFIGMATTSFRMMTAAALQAAGEPIVPMKTGFLTRGGQNRLHAIPHFRLVGIP